MLSAPPVQVGHFQKAAALMYCDKLTSERGFKCEFHASCADIRRFTHYYWFHAVADFVGALSDQRLGTWRGTRVLALA